MPGEWGKARGAVWCRACRGWVPAHLSVTHASHHDDDEPDTRPWPERWLAAAEVPDAGA